MPNQLSSREGLLAVVIWLAVVEKEAWIAILATNIILFLHVNIPYAPTLL